MGESFLYTWEDVDAPVLTASNGSFTNLLQAVLVDGYGSKPGLGWVSYFTGTNKKVFQNKGTETLVQFDHSQEANLVYVRGFESMSDIDNGVLPCPAFTYTENYLQIKGSATSPANVIPWRIFGDDKGFWIFVDPNYAASQSYTHANHGTYKPLYVGDYIPFDLTNIHHNFCVITGQIYPAYPLTSLLHMCGLGSVIANYWVRRGPDFTPGSVQAGMGSGSSYEGTALGHTPDMCDAQSLVQLTSIPTLHIGSTIIGRLPGLKNSLSRTGDHGAIFNPETYAYRIEVKPEMVFDQGGYKEHFILLRENIHDFQPKSNYIVMTEGKGFRNAI